MKEPKTLQEAIAYFADADRAFEFAVKLRWPDGKIACPRCDSDSNYFIKTRKLWLCRGCEKQFTLKVGTIFEDSALGLDKWMVAFWMLVNCRNGISSCEIGRTLGITQKSAWFMLQRLRLALQEKSFVKLGGSGTEVEVDETFIGGKARNMHKSVRARRISGRGKSAADKTIVLGILKRDGHVRTHVIPDRSSDVLQGHVRNAVDAGAAIFTDELHGYWGLEHEYQHKVIDHAVRYVDGNVHTNGMENFWSLLKRGLGGTYVSVEPFHLFRYLDEQAFRFNMRKDDNGQKISDAVRFAEAMSRVSGHRLTYSQLTGKQQSPRHPEAGQGAEQVPF